jgi:DNA-binding transcriptional MocR family regulator
VVRLMHRLDHVHRRNRRMVESALDGLVRLGGLGSVGSAVLHLPDRLDPRHTTTMLERQGIRVSPLTDYYGPDRPSPPGLVIGYGHLPGPALRAGLASLGNRLAELAG